MAIVRQTASLCDPWCGGPAADDAANSAHLFSWATVGPDGAQRQNQLARFQDWKPDQSVVLVSSVKTRRGRLHRTTSRFYQRLARVVAGLIKTQSRCRPKLPSCSILDLKINPDLNGLCFQQLAGSSIDLRCCLTSTANSSVSVSQVAFLSLDSFLSLGSSNSHGTMGLVSVEVNIHILYWIAFSYRRTG